MPGNILSPVGPQPIYIEQGNSLLLAITPAPGNAATQTYTIGVNMRLAADGIERFFLFQNFPQALIGAGPTYTQFPLPEGWLLSVNLTLLSTGGLSVSGQAGYNLAQLYAAPANIQIPNATVGNPSAQQSGILLIAACPPAFQTATWPVVTRFGTDGPGYNEVTTITSPAAGANLTFTFNQQKRSTIQMISFRLVTSATVANRQVALKITAAGDSAPYVMGQCPTVQAASQTVDYCFVPGVGPSTSTSAAAGIIQTAPFGSSGMQVSGTADILASIISGIDATDQISNIRLRLQSWNEQD